MKIRKLLFILLLIPSLIEAQVLEPSKWSEKISTTEANVGDEVELIFTAEIDKNWYLYSSDFDPDCGPLVTTFNFTPDISYELVGELRAIKSKEKYDDIFECNVRIFKGSGEFRQTIRILSPSLKVVGNYEFQVCSDVDGKCIPFDNDFEFNDLKIKGEAATISIPEEESNVIETKPEDVAEARDKKESNNAITQVNDPKVNYVEGENTGPIMDQEMLATQNVDKSIIWFMIFAFLAGFTSLLTPCVFPMIPMTVTFFLKNGKGIRDGIIFGGSIILIYTILGTLFTVTFGAEGLNALATNWILNLFIFVIFIIFALSFFGLFDINLPSSFVNKIDKQAERGGIIGIFFMATTLAVVSFSCTVPIAGSILFLSANGEFLRPILGMFAYAAAFAIPFTLLAIFPNWLNNLPKSGGWLNSVKVVLGFIELALAFKFLSIADQAYHWGILDREINIGIWIVIGTIMGFYLLGKIRLPHDTKLETISVQRLVMAIATFTFVLYLIPGLWGAPLKALAGYLPPMNTHDFNLVNLSNTSGANKICDEPKYADFLHLPHGINGYFDYDQAIACARSQNKPLFIDFTGHGCTNCREMEAVVWSEPEVLNQLKNDYVVVALYVDDKTVLPQSEWYTSRYDNKLKKTIGKQNADLQIRNLKNNAQPFYLLVDNEERVMVPPVAYDKNVKNFVKFLKEGKKQFYDK